MISNSAKYAINAVLYLSFNSDIDHKMSIAELGNAIEVPKAYLAKLMQELARHHLVSSLKGPKGGFYLSEENKQSHLKEIIDLIDGESRLSNCVLGIRTCNHEKPCPIHHKVHQYKDEFVSDIMHITIEELAKEIESGNAVLPIN